MASVHSVKSGDQLVKTAECMQTPRCRMEEHALCVLDVSQRQYPISQFAFAFTILSKYRAILCINFPPCSIIQVLLTWARVVHGHVGAVSRQQHLLLSARYKAPT